MATSSVLRVGREPDNDFVASLDTVSGYHARVSWSNRPVEAIIEDLGSTNGTAVNSMDRRGPRLSFTGVDTVYLGTHAVPGSELLKALEAIDAKQTRREELRVSAIPVVVGRDVKCDHVIADPVVSSRHARFTRLADGSVSIEDLGSANGTYINGRRIDRSGLARTGDSISLGSHTLVLAVESVTSPVVVPTTSPRSETPARPLTSPQAANAKAVPGTKTLPGGEWHAAWKSSWNPVVLLAVGPIAAAIVALTSGFDAAVLGDPVAGSSAMATLLSRLASAATVLGLLGGAISANRESGSRRLSGWLVRASVPAFCSGAACLFTWLTAGLLTGGRFTDLATLGILLLGAGAGLGLGLLLVALVPRPSTAWIVVAALVAPLWMIGGEGGVWRGLPSWAKTAAAINPARWTFEGLLINASDRLPLPTSAPDLAEPYFPAATERIGPRGATLALAAMLLGGAVAAAFIATAAEPRSPTRSVP